MTQQWLYIVALALVGAVMGTVFDVYNTVTSAAKWFRWLRPVLDVVFWALSAFVVYYVALRMDSGRLRIYTFILLVIGYGLYRVMFHATVVASAFRIVRFTQGILRAVARVLDVLVWRPIQMLLRILTRALSGLYQLGCKLESLLFWVLRGVILRVLWRWLGRIPQMERSFLLVGRVWKDFWDRTSNYVRARVIRS
ncbi:spore cortex biosynthesis protein YabQ [Alicyclobacillus mengziensis]|uniref:Spore cortex biosynthesis protein YabQ n=1 Tax=Alicyclobacillus mengziensis TaxID=2931921 RepID=A0A9X7Z890_9BACL|nr:spore cortex biosynthesis protein YabQ [Alicyclobacillus mengziensis]QSO47941.1 spore cortex biosynthesis protein YabQ [Alicyclobacillus mengziensis]